MPKISAVDLKPPFFVSALNTVGRITDSIGYKLAKLDGAAILSDAQEKTGLTDFGGDDFREGFDLLLWCLNNEAHLSLIGRLAAIQMMSNVLENRLHIVDCLKKNPDIEKQDIKKPLFIGGLPRTGTTILFNLLAEDPVARAPLTWETQFSVPPKTGPDKRKEDTTEILGGLARIAPHFKTIHPIEVEMPQECLNINAHNFASIQFMLSYDMPSYRDWYIKQDLTKTFQWHKKFIQVLNYYNPGRHWVLKTPSHVSSIEAIFNVYPDACFIQTHRELKDVIPSMASLYYFLHRLGTDTMSPERMGKIVTEYWTVELRRGMAMRKNLPEKQNQFYDVYFDTFMNDTLGTIKDIYRHFDMEFSDATLEIMKSYLDNNRRDKHGTHYYSLEMYGLDEAKINESFAYYRQNFMKKAVVTEA